MNWQSTKAKKEMTMTKKHMKVIVSYIIKCLKIEKILFKMRLKFLN